LIKETKLGLGDYIEKYRLVIGIVLLILVCGGISFLIYRENYWKPSIEAQISAQETRIAELETKLSGAKSEPLIVDPATIVQAITQPAVDAVPKSVAIAATPEVTAAAPATAAQSKIVHINTATLADFDSLPGIGPVLSKRILDYREKNGPFASIEGIKKVSGIGDKTYLKFKDLLAL
jgi:competence protein ComEA